MQVASQFFIQVLPSMLDSPVILISLSETVSSVSRDFHGFMFIPRASPSHTVLLPVTVAHAGSDPVAGLGGRRLVLLHHEGRSRCGIARAQVRTFERALDGGIDL